MKQSVAFISCRATVGLWLVLGFAPIVATHAALWINTSSGELAGCLPYWDGCTSISRGVRSGPGLPLFRAIMLPAAALLAVGWLLMDRWLRLHLPAGAKRGWQLALGLFGAFSLVMYVAYLGEDGGFYRFMRRYGVYGYFGGTALAQLLLVAQLRDSRWRGWPVIAISWLVWGLWAFGIGFATRIWWLDDPELLDRVENVVEWVFALLLHLVPFTIAGLLARHPIGVTAHRLT